MWLDYKENVIDTENWAVPTTNFRAQNRKLHFVSPFIISSDESWSRFLASATITYARTAKPQPMIRYTMRSTHTPFIRVLRIEYIKSVPQTIKLFSNLVCINTR